MLDARLSETAETLRIGDYERQPRLVRGTRYTVSTYLPLDAQQRMTAAIDFAQAIRTPITMMLTVNAAHLQRMDSGGVFEVGHLWDGFQRLEELMRKWATQRGIPWACVWVREYTGGRNNHSGEHWHIAFHLRKKHRAAFVAQVAEWTDEPLGAPDARPTTIARSETGAWHIRTADADAAAYLGKATPRHRKRYGKQIPNTLRSGHHKGGQGPIEGKRFGMSKTIGKTAQGRHRDTLNGGIGPEAFE